MQGPCGTRPGTDPRPEQQAAGSAPGRRVPCGQNFRQAGPDSTHTGPDALGCHPSEGKFRLFDDLSWAQVPRPPIRVRLRRLNRQEGMSKASQFLFALPAPGYGTRSTSQRRAPAPAADLPPRPCNSSRPSTSDQPWRLPMPVRFRQGSLGIQHCRVLFPTDRPVFALYHPDALPLARSLHLHRQVANRKFSVRPGSSLPRNNILPPDIAGLLIHRERWSSAPTNGSPSCPCGRITSPRLLFHNTLTAAKATRSSYNHSSAVVFPRGVHSMVAVSPSSPPTTARHAPPDVGAFRATSLLPKDLASVTVPRQLPEGRHHALSRPHIPLLDWTQFGPATIKDAGCPDSTRNLLPNQCAVKEFGSMHSTEPETASYDRRDQNPSYRSPHPLE